MALQGRFCIPGAHAPLGGDGCTILTELAQSFQEPGSQAVQKKDAPARSCKGLQEPHIAAQEPRATSNTEIDLLSATKDSDNASDTSTLP